MENTGVNRTSHANDSIRCSFCHKRPESGAKLISSPQEHPRAYICDECIAVCHCILEDDKAELARETGIEVPNPNPHPLAYDPLVSDLLWAIERWRSAESLGNDGTAEIAELRKISDRLCNRV
jgi:hypothetical protein